MMRMMWLTLSLDEREVLVKNIPGLSHSTMQGGVVMQVEITHAIIKIHTLAPILDTWALIFGSYALFTVYPNHIM